MNKQLNVVLTALTYAALSFTHGAFAKEVAPPNLQQVVDEAIAPIQQQYGVPGIAVGVTTGGKHAFYNYGVASKDALNPVTRHTLFEIGSLSKTFTATLACYAAANGKLSLSDKASQYLPPLRGTRFDQVSLRNLGTHTSGLPLFVPENIANNEQLMTFLRGWKPEHAAGTYRVYSNPGIGTLGLVAAKSMNQPFDAAIQNTLLPALGMTHTYLQVPGTQMKDYAQGYRKDDTPARLSPGALASEAYGIKSDTTDLVRFLDANMNPATLDPQLRRAIDCTHTGYYAAKPFVQDLIWEQYPYPVALTTLLAGNAPEVIYQGVAATELNPPLPPQTQALLNKTGSTNGFSAYAMFVPARQIGVVILANKSYPIEARVAAAYRILSALNGINPH